MKTSSSARAALEYQEIFGDNNFFLEVQNNGIDIQDRVNALVDSRPGPLDVDLRARQRPPVGGGDPNVDPIIEALHQSVAELSDGGGANRIFTEKQGRPTLDPIAGRIHRGGRAVPRSTWTPVAATARSVSAVRREISPPWGRMVPSMSVATSFIRSG